MRLALTLKIAVGLGHVEVIVLGELRRRRVPDLPNGGALRRTEGEAEAARHVFGGSSCFDDGGEGLCLVGRVHCESLEVCKVGFAHFAFLAFDARQVTSCVSGKVPAPVARELGDRQPRPRTAALPVHDEVVAGRARHVRPQLEVGQHVARLANVRGLGTSFFMESTGSCSPDGMKAQVRIEAHKPTLPPLGDWRRSEGSGGAVGRTNEAPETGTNSRVR